MNRADAEKLARSALGESMLTLNDVAKHLSVSPRTCRRWLADGELVPDFRMRGVVRFRTRTVERFIRDKAVRV